MLGSVTQQYGTQPGRKVKCTLSSFFSIMIRRPSSTMIVGPLGCSKTRLTETLLKEGTVFEDRKARPCHYCYAMWQPPF